MSRENWFKHDVDSRLVPAMAAFLAEVGAIGYGVFWVVVEEMHRASESKKKQTKANLKNISKMLSCDFELFSKIVNCAVSCGLWYFEGDLLCSERVEREVNERHIRAQKIKEIRSAAGRAGGRPKSKAKQTKASESKIKQNAIDKSRLDKSRSLIPLAPPVRPNLPISESDLTAIRQQYGSPQVEAELDTCSDWLKSTGRKYKDYPAFFRNWMRRAALAKNGTPTRTVQPPSNGPARPKLFKPPPLPPEPTAAERAKVKAMCAKFLSEGVEKS